jgi:hypothetical protein
MNHFDGLRVLYLSGQVRWLSYLMGNGKTGRDTVEPWVIDRNFRFDRRTSADPT